MINSIHFSISGKINQKNFSNLTKRTRFTRPLLSRQKSILAYFSRNLYMKQAISLLLQYVSYMEVKLEKLINIHTLTNGRNYLKVGHHFIKCYIQVDFQTCAAIYIKAIIFCKYFFSKLSPVIIRNSRHFLDFCDFGLTSRGKPKIISYNKNSKNGGNF